MCRRLRNPRRGEAEPGEQDGKIYLKRIMPSPLGEGGRRPDEGRPSRCSPFTGNRGKAAPHQSPSVTASPEGEAFFVLYILHKKHPSFLVSEND